MRKRRNVWMIVALITSAVAMCVHGYTALVNSDDGPSLFGAALFIWSMLPYGVGSLIAMRSNALAGALAVLGSLVVDVLLYYSVFIEPESSTAALGLLFAPGFNLLIVLPVALLLGYLISRRSRPRPA